MEQFRRSSEGSRSDPSPEWGETGLEEPMWQLGLGGGGGGEESYPQRPDEADCTYYLRTGFCGFGERCRFNHPRDRAAVIGAARITGGYPERLGQPVCQYYMRTRSCKFGASCKYDHPRQSGGGSTTSPVSLNYHGYPLRPGEKECSYYAKTGQCKFGATCKFDHPPSAGVQIPAPSPVPPLSPLPVPVPVPVPSPLYPTAQPPAGHSSQQIGVLVARPPLLPGSFVQSAYGPVVMSPTMVPISGWGPYQSPTTSPLLPSSTPSNVGSAQLYGITQLPAYTGPYQPSGSSVGPSSGIRKEQTFPERPNQAEYQYYSKTGEFTIGSSYGYHQSPDMNAPQVNVLSPAGLPLRPGAPPCTHYAQRGACKFGPACRFDHSMVPISQSPSASSLADVPVAPYPVGSSVGMLAPSSSSSSSSSSSEMQPELTTGSSKESIPTQISSSVSTSTGSVGSTLFTGVPVSQSSTQSSSPLAAANTTPSSDVSNTSS